MAVAMFLIIRRPRIQQILGPFSAFFIVHLALARITERDTFGTSPPAPSVLSSSADSIGAPIAFPIFRPPMVSVHRQKSTAEQERRRTEADFLHNSSPPLHNQSKAEQISATSGGTSSVSSSVVEDDDNLSQQQEGEELAFSPVQIFSNTKTNNTTSDNNHSPPVAFHRLESFGTHRNGNDSIGRTTKMAFNLQPTHPTKGPIGSNSAPSSTINTTAHRVLPFSNVARSSITPQFPVFTGMGMEIIESGESEGERSSTSAVAESNNEENWLSLHRKMHYNFTNESKLLNNVVQPKKVIGQSQNINNSTVETTVATTKASSTFMPSIRIESLTNPTIIGNILGHNRTIGAIDNSTQPFETTAAEDEVTEDLLAMFTSTEAPSVQHENPSKPPSQKTTDGKQEDVMERKIGDHPTQILTKLPTMGSTEAIIPRPTTAQQQQSLSSHMKWPTTTTHQSTSSSTTTRTTAMIATEPTQLPKTTTTKEATQLPTTTTTKTTTTIAKTTTAEHFGDMEMHMESTDGRITIGTKRKTQTTTMDTQNNGEWLWSNHIEEGNERVTTTTQKMRLTTSTASSWSSTRRKNGGEPNLKQQKNKNALESNRTTDENANFRLLIIAGIISVLFVAVGIGSICTGRYVRKSRQLHGKYRPAAYELQTTRPPPLTGSSMAFPPSNRMANCNEPQQNRHFEFSNIHQMPPAHCPHQQLTNGNDGREERLI